MALLLLLGWTTLAPAWSWTLAALGILVVPALAASLLELLRRPDDVPLAQHLLVSSRMAMQRAAQIAFTLACLPYEAWFSAVAILQTHWRMFVTHRRLLEWAPSSEPDHRTCTTIAASFRMMWIAPVVAIAAGSYLVSMNSGALASAAPFLLLRLLSPALAWWCIT